MVQPNRFNRPTVEVSIPRESWVAVGEEPDVTTKLIAKLNIDVGSKYSVMLHLEALAVHESDGVQTGDTKETDQALGELYHAFDTGKLSTVEIDGRNYVLFAYPFED